MVPMFYISGDEATLNEGLCCQRVEDRNWSTGALCIS